MLSHVLSPVLSKNEGLFALAAPPPDTIHFGVMVSANEVKSTLKPSQVYTLPIVKSQICNKREKYTHKRQQCTRQVGSAPLVFDARRRMSRWPGKQKNRPRPTNSRARSLGALLWDVALKTALRSVNIKTVLSFAQCFGISHGNRGHASLTFVQ